MNQSRTIRSNQIKRFRKTVYDHFDTYGRKLPWRRTKDPYKILVSEIMLQQTQVPRVVDKYREFIRTFPTIKLLDRAPLRRVMSAWQGLGYNRRALLLKRLAREVVARHDAKIPNSVEVLQSLPGIGQATASSICAFAFNQPTVFIETNIRSVFLHHFFKDRNNVADAALLPLVAKTLDRLSPHKWYSALMDYGVFLKNTNTNPSRRSSHHQKQSRFQGSDRQLRGAILRLLLGKKKILRTAVIKKCGKQPTKTNKLIAQLCREGLVRERGDFLLV